MGKPIKDDFQPLRLMRIADPVLDPAYHFDADPDANPDFYLMAMRIQVTKMMRIRNNL